MPGFASDATYGSVLFANNIDFTGTSPYTGSGQVTTDGQLLIGSAAAPHIKVGTITSPNNTITVGYSSPNITLDLAGGHAAIETINGDTGSISGNTVTIYADNAANNCGSSVKFVNSGTVSTLNVTDANANTIIGVNAGNASIIGGSQVALGSYALNQYVGVLSYGPNTAIGANSLTNLLTGIKNVCIGSGTGGNYTGAESNNIIVGDQNAGNIGESNVTRLGNSGTTTCYITGIDGVNVGSVAKVVTEASNQLGTATLTAGTGITITPTANTITIATTGTTVLTVTSVTHGASPYTVLSTDDFLACQTSGGVITVKLPNAPTTGRVIIIKDSNGAAATSNISVTTVGGAINIDGVTTYTMATNYQSISVIFDGSNYEVY